MLSANNPHDIQWRYAKHLLQKLRQIHDMYHQGDESVITALKRFDEDWLQIRHAWYWLLEEEKTNDVHHALVDYAIHAFTFISVRLAYDEQLNWIRHSLGSAQILGNSDKEMQLLFMVGEVHRMAGKNQEAEPYLCRSLELAQQEMNTIYVIRCLIRLGWIDYAYGNYSKALNAYNQAYTLALEVHDTHHQATALSYTGVTLISQGFLEDAKQKLEQAYQIYSSQNTIHGIANICLHLGMLYRSLQQYGKARTYFTESLSHAQKLKSQHQQADVYLSLGVLASQQHHFTEALYYYKRCQVIFKSLNSQVEQARVLNNMGMIELRIGQYQSASEYFRESVSLKRQANEQASLALTLGNWGYASTRLKHYDDAFTYLKEAVEILQSVEHRAVQVRIIAYLVDLIYIITNDATLVIQGIQLVKHHPNTHDELQRWLELISEKIDTIVLTNPNLKISLPSLMQDYIDLLKNHQASLLRV